jgi:hypothetical protein
MSLQVPATAQIQRPKAYFYFHSPTPTVFSSPTVSDTTGVTTAPTIRTTAKTYTLNIPEGANTIRVIVHGKSGPGYAITVILNIDGVDVASATIDTGGATVVVLDYVGSISPGSHTIRIDYYSSAANVVSISAVYIATGIGLTSTTPTTIATFTLRYYLLRQGDIRYSPGVRVFVFGNRKTTAPLTLTIPEATNIIVGRNNLGAGNDTTVAETILAIMTGSVAFQEGGGFTLNISLRGNVGVSGDVVIITKVLARAQLRREHRFIGEVRVYERGVVEYAGRLFVIPVPGGVRSSAHAIQIRDARDEVYAESTISGSGSDVVVFNFRIAVVTSVHFQAHYDDDVFGEAFLDGVSVVVWG